MSRRLDELGLFDMSQTTTPEPARRPALARHPRALAAGLLLPLAAFGLLGGCSRNRRASWPRRAPWAST